MLNLSPALFGMKINKFFFLTVYDAHQKCLRYSNRTSFLLFGNQQKRSEWNLSMKLLQLLFMQPNNEWGSGDIVGKIDGNVVFELAAGESLRGEGNLWETFDCYGKVLVGKLKGKVDEASEI
jgi:hypothetical protein